MYQNKHKKIKEQERKEESFKGFKTRMYVLDPEK